MRAGAANLASESALLPGDLDSNGLIDSTNRGELLSNFGSMTNTLYCNGNINGDVSINSSDLGTLLAGFGQSASAATVAVPEPQFAGWWLTIFAVLILRSRRSFTS